MLSNQVTYNTVVIILTDSSRRLACSILQLIEKPEPNLEIGM